MKDFGSHRYVEELHPNIRSDFMVTPIAGFLAKKEIERQLVSCTDPRVCDIGSGNGLLANSILFNSELQAIEAIEPTLNLYRGFYLSEELNQERLKRNQDPKIYIPWRQTATEYLEAKASNTFAIIILCMVTLHFTAQELVEVMNLTSNKIRPGGSILIADLHTSRFDPADTGMKKKVILPTVDPNVNFELEYYPRPFEDITSPLLEHGFKLERTLIPALNQIKIIDNPNNITRQIPHKWQAHPRIFDSLSTNDTPYQISLLRKNTK
jgi:phospholipid N-methyltransferase